MNLHNLTDEEFMHWLYDNHREIYNRMEEYESSLKEDETCCSCDDLKDRIKEAMALLSEAL